MHEPKNPRMGAHGGATLARRKYLRRAAVLREMGRRGPARSAGAGAGRITRALRREAREFCAFGGPVWVVVWSVFVLVLWVLVRLAEAMQ